MKNCYINPYNDLKTIYARYCGISDGLVDEIKSIKLKVWSDDNDKNKIQEFTFSKKEQFWEMFQIILWNGTDGYWLWLNKEELVKLCGKRIMARCSLNYSVIRILSTIYKENIYIEEAETLDSKTEVEIYCLNLKTKEV